MQIKLTDQQQAVVAHDYGPALVFAVAGAGKTTAMVHRIERLVREEVFLPNRILATSFGRANVADMRRALSPWPHCRAVDTRTLHSLGWDLIRRAQRHGYLTTLDLNGRLSSQHLLTFTLAEARKRNVHFKRELDGLDRQDFLDYVGYCKGNLHYADPERAQLPQEGRAVASAARAPAPPLDWYLDLYRMFERVRLQNGAVTFDDMLMAGWEALVRYPDVLDEVRQQYHCVLVDEFQDINLAQSAMLDLITAPARHYMAIGDDDQTIYEWRGADPSFILNFAETYDATTYLISDNFRCPAGPLVLANRVIAHNQKRQPKQLSLTRGFDGETQVHVDKDVAQMSRRIVARIQQLHDEGMDLNGMAVLVRLNAQTPYIEQYLIEEGIPYRVSKPFYERSEIKTLINYGRIAWLEQQMAEGKRPLTNPHNRAMFREAWANVCNRPKRYISRDERRQMERAIIHELGAIAEVIQQAAEQTPKEWLAEKLEFFADDVAWLAQSLERPVAAVLRELEARLIYKEFLRENSGFPQTGDGRAAGVDAFIAYANGQGSFLQFMGHIKQLADKGVGKLESSREDAVTLSTIHRAKGLEWPVVFVPQCNDETIPFEAERTADLEEERRLFYVAVTRTKQQLHLYCVEDEPLSPFLREARWRETLADVDRMARLLQQRPARWQDGEQRWLQGKVHAFNLQRYFELWAEDTAVAGAII